MTAKKSNSDIPLETVTALAKTFRVSRQSIYNWGRRGCPLSGGVDAIRAWLTAEKAKAAKSPTGLKAKLLRVKIAKEKALTTKQELANAQTAGSLLDRVDVRTGVAIGFVRVKEVLESLPHELVAEVPADFKALILDVAENNCHRALIGLSQATVVENETFADMVLKAAEDIRARRGEGK